MCCSFAFTPMAYRLKRCQEQCGPFHCHLLSAWRGLVRRRRQRLRSECWVLKRQHSWQEPWRAPYGP